MAYDRFIKTVFAELQEADCSPVFDYEYIPVLTLEEATEKIIPLVSGVINYVLNAKKRCNRNSPLLTWDESAAIYLYSMPISFFARLNEALQAGNRHALKPWLAFLKLFTTALEKLPSTKKTVWRGVSGDVRSIFSDNDVHIWWSINSCSMDIKVVEQYLGGTGTVFAIDTIHGKDITKFSMFPEEQEIVLMPGTRVRTKCQALNYENRFFLVHLEEENPSSYLFESIKHEYQRNSRIERIMNPSESFPIEQIYINLAIVEVEKQHEKEKELLDIKHSNDAIGTYEEIYGTKSNIEIKNIFEKCKDQTKKILVFGRAAIGKTTFCRYLAYQWAIGAIWQQYQLVIFIRLRCLTESRYPPLPSGINYSLIDILKKEYFHHGLSEKDETLLKEQFDSSQFLWLLDGYDEIVQNVPAHLQYLLEQLLTTSHHILTSRSYLNTLSYDVQLEITGLTIDNIKKYVKYFHDQIKGNTDDTLVQAQKQLRFLECNPRIWGIAHIPVNLEIICSFRFDADWSETTTITTVYDKMTEWICRRNLEKQNIVSIQMTKEDIYAYYHKELAFLESLAFNGMESNTIILRSQLLRIASTESECSLQHHSHLLHIGILKSFDNIATDSYIGTDKNYYFVHLSFQEHFAARYLVKALRGNAFQKQNATNFIKAHKYNERFELVFSFASGLLIGTDDEQSINLFWDTLLGEPLDLIGLRYVQLVIACLDETDFSRCLPRFQESMNLIIKWIKYFVSQEHEYFYRHMQSLLRRSSSLMKQPEVLHTLVKFCKYHDPSIKQNALLLIFDLPILNLPTELIHLFLAIFNDENDEVKRTVCEILGKMGEKAATNEVINGLMNALEDTNSDIRWSVCQTLGKMGEKAATSEVINRLVTVLKDENPQVRSEARSVLLKMGEKAANNEVISRLVSALDDTDPQMISEACAVLITMGEKAATNEVICKLVIALGDINPDVRWSACQTLGKIGEKTATSEVINILVTVLEDTNPQVRSEACSVLTTMGEKAATDEVISRLVSALEDACSDVKWSACQALGKMGEKAATYEVINRLVVILADADDLVRKSAYLTLEKMSEKTGINAVINSLITSLKNDNWVVRRSACEALGKLGEKAATNDVINRLVILSRDKNREVRWNAPEIVGNVDQNVARNEVIDGLADSLRDENAQVRESACGAIGRMGEKAATSTVINRLMTALWDTDGRVRSTASRTLGEIGVKAAPDDFDKLIKTLVTASNDGSPEVRQCAWETIGIMGEAVATSDVINRLAMALRDENSEVRRSACRVVTKMGEIAVTDVVINALMVTLKHENANVRLSACQALGEIAEKLATDSVITALVTAFGDSNPEVRSIVWDTLLKLSDGTAINDLINRMAIALESQNTITIRNICKILTKMGEKVVTADITNRLIAALVDQNPEVRWNACNTLGEMGEKVATSEAINGLVTALKDNDGRVRSNACEALGKLGEKAVTNNVIVGLENALADDQDGVKLKACITCGKLGPKAVTIGMFNRLLIVLKSKNPEVRQSACETLGKMGAKAVRDDIINRLVTALVDKNPDVRRSACDTLGKMGRKVVRDDIINGLITALMDKNPDVRRSACETLGKMGEKAASNEVINSLVTVLDDNNPDVRLYAGNTVGRMDEKADPKDGLLTDIEVTQIHDMDEVVVTLSRMLSSFSAITQLHSDTILKLNHCINRLMLNDWIAVPVEHFTRVFLYTKHSEWLPIVTTIALLEENAVCVTKNAIKIYGSKECVELDIPSEELRQKLVEAFVSQGSRVHISSEMLLKDEFKPEDVDPKQPQPENVGEIQVTDNNPANTTDQLSRNPSGTVSSLEFTSTAESMASKSDSNNLVMEQPTKETNAAEACIDDIVVKLNEISLSSPHVQVIKSEDRTDRISVQAAPSCCSDLIGLTLTDNTQCILDEITSNKVIHLKGDINIFVVGLHVDPSVMQPPQEIVYKFKQFSNDLDCVSDLLSNTNTKENRLIYFVLPSSRGKFIIPLIHGHRCVERVYLYNDANNSQNLIWTYKYSKIVGSWSSFDKIQEQLTKDVKLVMTRPSRWTRSQQLFIDLWTQQPLHVNMSFTVDVEEQTFNTRQIVTLFCDGQERFYLSHNGLDFPKFDDIQRCSDLITECEISSIFLVICGVSSDNLVRIRSLIDHRSVHAVYVFINADEQYICKMDLLYASSKISGVFASHCELLVQLATDICFYRQIPANIPRMDLLKINSEVLAHLEGYEREFLRYQLLIDILPQLFSSTYIGSEPPKFINVTDPSLINIKLGQKINNLFKKCDLRAILKSKSSILYADMDIRLLPTNILSSSITVYHAQLISDDDLDMIRKNSNALFSVFSCVIASDSYPPVVEICRRAINNGLTIVLFEIKLLKGASINRILADPDICVFPLGTRFRLKSIEQMPDNVWHVHAELSNIDIQHFKEQLQFETDKALALSTINDYWTVLDQLEPVKDSDK